ncbi:MAG: low molecular weight protein-tyrosine-phosphatase [Lachnospiraceae bacterium]
MIKILFVCHGNICRSPMAELLMRDMIQKSSLSDQISVASAATSTEEIGNPVHTGTVEKLRKHGISAAGKTAIQLTKRDYAQYDYLIGMDDWNIRNILRIIGSDKEQKVHKLLSFAGIKGDIADPWYTGNFDRTYEDVKAGCEGLLKILKEKI